MVCVCEGCVDRDRQRGLRRHWGKSASSDEDEALLGRGKGINDGDEVRECNLLSQAGRL